MAKLTNVRERIHQPFYDTLIRTSGIDGNATVANSSLLFTNAPRSQGSTVSAVTNLLNGSTLPSDQSHVTLALRVFTWFRASTVRGVTNEQGVLTDNGDFSIAGATDFFETGGPGNGQALGRFQDVYRLHFQAQEQLHWSFGTGEKNSISNMATKYFPDGGGLSGDNGGVSELIHWQNGSPDHTAILRLARAILLPPRQNIKCEANIFAYADGGNSATAGMTQGSRNMLSLVDNLNALDGINKCVQFTFDGLFARDVQ